MDNITLTLEEFHELTRKEFAYDMYREHLMRGCGYVTDVERILFDIPAKDKKSNNDEEV